MQLHLDKCFPCSYECDELKEPRPWLPRTRRNLNPIRKSGTTCAPALPKCRPGWFIRFFSIHRSESLGYGACHHGRNYPPGTRDVGVHAVPPVSERLRIVHEHLYGNAPDFRTHPRHADDRSADSCRATKPRSTGRPRTLSPIYNLFPSTTVRAEER